MPRWMCWAIVLAVGCGRIGFDATANAPGDGTGTGDGTPDGIAQVQIPPGAGIWLQMETDPGVAIDSAGGHTVACAGTCPARVAGHRGTGYHFVQEELHVVYAADLDPSTGFTAGVWVEVDVYDPSPTCVWSKPFGFPSTFDTFTLCVDGVGTTIFDSETPGGSPNSFTGPVIALGTWHHLAMTWDGTTKRGYVDGVPIGSSVTDIGRNTEAFTLGSERGGYHLNGTVDDAVYYRRALSPTEIMQLATP
jgi:hypothetical protein